LSLTESVPVKKIVTATEALPANVTLIVQFAPATNMVPQLFVCEKLASLLLVGMIFVKILKILNVAVPLLLSVTGAGELFEPGLTLKDRLVGDRDAVGTPAAVELAPAGLETGGY
jgi:hypothetical protein